MEFDNTNRGAIFPNSKKENEKQPDRTGSIDIEGVEYWVSGWDKVSKSGNPFLSLSVTKKESLASKTTETWKKDEKYTQEVMQEDEIPF